MQGAQSDGCLCPHILIQKSVFDLANEGHTPFVLAYNVVDSN